MNNRYFSYSLSKTLHILFEGRLLHSVAAVYYKSATCHKATSIAEQEDRCTLKFLRFY
jgi:hypothetical protein